MSHRYVQLSQKLMSVLLVAVEIFEMTEACMKVDVAGGKKKFSFFF